MSKKFEHSLNFSHYHVVVTELCFDHEWPLNFLKTQSIHHYPFNRFICFQRGWTDSDVARDGVITLPREELFSSNHRFHPKNESPPSNSTTLISQTSYELQRSLPNLKRTLDLCLLPSSISSYPFLRQLHFPCRTSLLIEEYLYKEALRDSLSQRLVCFLPLSKLLMDWKGCIVYGSFCVS